MVAISVQGLVKHYHIYAKPIDRLKEFIFKKSLSSTVRSLQGVSFTVGCGETLGVVGRNGAGKSTLLKILAGTVMPTIGEVVKNGRVAALLELGAGFNPEFSGLRNIYFNANLLGLSNKVIRQKEQEIIAFSELEEFIRHPLKFYSSGMVVRLAFAIASCIDPDILIIDEALSVGDGAFARKSFDKIMEIKKAGKTILFCSHSLYQVEALCDRAIWLEEGAVRCEGSPSQVCSAYNGFLSQKMAKASQANSDFIRGDGDVGAVRNHLVLSKAIQVSVDGQSGRYLHGKSCESEVRIRVGVCSDLAVPAPSVGVGFVEPGGQIVASVATTIDEVVLERDLNGEASITVSFPAIALLKGCYTVDVCILSEDGIHVYEYAKSVATIELEQDGLEQGLVSLTHKWS